VLETTSQWLRLKREWLGFKSEWSRRRRSGAWSDPSEETVKGSGGLLRYIPPTALSSVLWTDACITFPPLHTCIYGKPQRWLRHSLNSAGIRTWIDHLCDVNCSSSPFLALPPVSLLPSYHYSQGRVHTFTREANLIVLNHRTIYTLLVGNIIPQRP
jgi:hypothetical protein